MRNRAQRHTDGRPLEHDRTSGEIQLYTQNHRRYHDRGQHGEREPQEPRIYRLGADVPHTGRIPHAQMAAGRSARYKTERSGPRHDTDLHCGFEDSPVDFFFFAQFPSRKILRLSGVLFFIRDPSWICLVTLWRAIDQWLLLSPCVTMIRKRWKKVVWRVHSRRESNLFIVIKAVNCRRIKIVPFFWTGRLMWCWWWVPFFRLRRTRLVSKFGTNFRSQIYPRWWGGNVVLILRASLKTRKKVH